MQNAKISTRPEHNDIDRIILTQPFSIPVLPFNPHYMLFFWPPLLFACLTVGSTTTTTSDMRNLLTLHRRAASSASALTPPLSADITAKQIEDLTASIKSQFRTTIDDMLLLQNDKDASSSASVLDTLSATFGEASEVSALVTLPSMTHGDLAARSASTKAKDELKRLFDETLARPELYRKIESDADESCKDSHLYRLFATAFRRNGCQLEADDTREILLQKRNEIEETSSAFCSSINEYTETVTVTAAELDGVENLDQFPTDGQTIEIPLKAPYTVPILQFSKLSSTRKAVAVASARKCQDVNTDRFLSTVQLRHDCATILGYESHAAFMLDSNMAGTVEGVETFLWDLVEKLKPHRDADLKVLQALKDGDTDAESGPLQPWDISYYIRVHKATLGVDEAALQQYFPLEHVKSEILSIYEELLGLKFVKVTDDVEVWHEDVDCFAVHNGAASGNDDHEPLGFFYFDLYPREGKYSHQCVYPLRPSYNPTGKNNDESGDDTHRVKPACVNIGNLSRGKDGEPSLLRFREVETFFHEFGHVMHCVLAKSEHSLQAWAWSAVPWPGGVEQDFLEVPSMMLENFVWQKEVLKRLSKNSADSTSLPDGMMESLSKSRTTMEGYSRCRYLAMALYDLKVHSGPGPYEHNGKEYDAIALYSVMMEDISGVSNIPDTFPVASWFHLMMGYDAGYYSYIWSEVLAADLFSEFETGHDDVSVLNSELGRKYRDTILSPCATVDGDTMLRNFLGRSTSNAAFLNRVVGK